jgi:hypothetical protein
MWRKVRDGKTQGRANLGGNLRRNEQTTPGGEMSLKHLIIGAVVAVCTFVAQAAAQKNELSGILGRTFISDQGIQGAPSYDPDLRFGNGLTFEVNYARRVVDAGLFSLALEVPFVVNPDEDLHAAHPRLPKQVRIFLCDSRSTIECLSRSGSFSLGQFWWRIRPFQ